MNMELIKNLKEISLLKNLFLAIFATISSNLCEDKNSFLPSANDNANFCGFC